MDIDKTMARLEVDEAFVPYVYDDATGEPIRRGGVVRGHPTIGTGHCVELGVGPPIPREVDELWTRLDLTEKWADLTARAPWIMDQPAEVQRGLANMAYQMGASGVIAFRNMLDALRRGDRPAAADHCLDSEYARQTPDRARRVAELIGGPSWAGPS